MLRFVHIVWNERESDGTSRCSVRKYNLLFTTWAMILNHDIKPRHWTKTLTMTLNHDGNHNMNYYTEPWHSTKTFRPWYWTIITMTWTMGVNHLMHYNIEPWCKTMTLSHSINHDIELGHKPWHCLLSWQQQYLTQYSQISLKCRQSTKTPYSAWFSTTCHCNFTRNQHKALSIVQKGYCTHSLVTHF